jgi:hypothetical protein
MSQITVTEATYDFSTGETLTMERAEGVVRLVDRNGDVVGWAGTRTGALIHALELLRQEHALKATWAPRSRDQRTTAQVVKARRAGRELARMGVVGAERTPRRGGAYVTLADGRQRHTDRMQHRLSATVFAIADHQATA